MTGPSLQELGRVCQKPHWRHVGFWLARRFARPIAIPITFLVVRTPMSANAVTGLAMVVGFSSAIPFGFGTHLGATIGGGLLLAWYVLDHVDGQVARFRGTESVTGVYLDFVMHHLVHASVIFSLGFGLAVRDGSLRWVLAAALASLGAMTLGLLNDCMAKAIYCELSRRRDAWRAQPSQAVSPAKPPLRRRAIHTIYRCFDFPNVVVTLAVVAAMGWIQSHWFLAAYPAYVGLLAIMLPMLAAVRLTRHVLLRVPDQHYVQQTMREDDSAAAA